MDIFALKVVSFLSGIEFLKILRQKAIESPLPPNVADFGEENFLRYLDFMLC